MKRDRTVSGRGDGGTLPTLAGPVETAMTPEATAPNQIDVLAAEPPVSAGPANAEAQESRAWLAAIVESSEDAIIGKTLQGQITSWNAGATRLFGYTPEEAIGRPVTMLFPEDRKAEEVEILSRVSRGERVEHFETERVGKDGRRIDISLTVSPVRDAAGRIIGVSKIARNITQRKHAEQALHESEERFRNMADYAPVLIWLNGINGCEYVNREYLHFLGCTFEEVRGDRWRDFLHPDDAAGYVAEYSQAVERRKPFTARCRLRRADGQYRWMLSTGVPRFTRDGSMLGYVGCSMDITDQERARQMLEEQQAVLEDAVVARTAELEQSNQRLRLAERMASLGTLSAGLGHDMGNLLVPVRIRLESLSRASLPQDLREDIEAIRTSAEYLQRLANGLRMLAIDPGRSTSGEVTLLSAWWNDVAVLLKSALPRGINIASRLPDGECWVPMSRAALTQVIFNLAQNAGDAMRARGSGSVTVWAELQADEVRIGVTDDGPGMTDEVKRRCMEPFFTTKTRGFSTGLGLVLVYGLVRDAGGSVHIDSAPGRGATFTLRLPAASTRRVNMDGERSRRAVVDLKNPRLRAFVAAELRSLAYDVTLGRDRADGVDLFVVEDLDDSQDVRTDATVVLVGGLHSTNRSRASVVLDPNVGPREIREALRGLAVAAERAPLQRVDSVSKVPRGIHVSEVAS
jgi:PAS domain S-box-containing protein